jgi:hypothetical protein
VKKGQKPKNLEYIQKLRIGMKHSEASIEKMRQAKLGKYVGRNQAGGDYNY